MFDFRTKQNYIINLDRRQDRLMNLINMFNVHGVDMSKFIKLSAVDGKTTDFSHFNWLFESIDRDNITNPAYTHKFKKGTLGCALSHFKVWELIAASEYDDNDFFLICEDDIKFVPNFKEKYNKAITILENDAAWDITFIGYTDDRDFYGDTIIYDGIKKFSGNPRKHGGGLFSYLIRKKAARKLINIAVDRGMAKPVDWFVIDQYDKMCCYRCIDDIIVSQATFNGNKDSDIQFE